MLDFLREWAMVLAGVVVFGSLCEVILPDSSFQKYIRLAIGLILVLTLIMPMQQLLRFKLPQEDASAVSKAVAYREREEMEERQKKEVMRIYKQNLNQKMAMSLEKRLGNVTAEIRCDVEEKKAEEFGAVQEVLVLIDAAQSSDVTKQVKKILTQDYGILEQQVVVRYLKEQNG